MARGGYGQVWTPEEDAQIRRLGGHIGAEALARLLHRSVDGVRKQARKLGVSLDTGGAGSFWTPQEDAVLREQALRRPWPEIAEMLGRSAQGCKHRARTLGLIHKPKKRYAPPRAKEGMRKCHDCGCPTPDFRCQKCWARIRASGDYSCDDEVE